MSEIVLIAGTCFEEAKKSAARFRELDALVYELPATHDVTARDAVLKEIEKEGKLDYLIIQAEYRSEKTPVFGNLDYAEMSQLYSKSVCDTFDLVEAALPLLSKGKKRLGLITDASASIREVTETTDYGYAMAKAGLHMLWKIYFNKLHPEGYTFRCFSPNPDGSGISATEYMRMDFCYDERENFLHSEENRLVMRDGWFREITW